MPPVNASISDASVAAPPDGAPITVTTSWEVRVLLGVAVALGAVIPLAVAFHTGSIHLPHNDAWAFSRTAQVFAHTGHVKLFGWNAMALVGQAVAAFPFGTSLAAQQCAVAAAGVLGLLATFDLLRASIGERRAALAAVVIALWPAFGLLTTSFMTDVPVFAAIAVTLALGRRALDRGSLPWLCASCAVGFGAVTIREQAIAAPAGVLAVAILQRRTRQELRLARLLFLGALLILALGVFEAWRRGLPNGSTPAFASAAPKAGKAVVEVFESWSTLALAVSPAVLLAARPWSWGRRAQAVSIAAFGLCLITAVVDQPFLGNYLDADGAYSAAYLGARPVILPTPIWDLMIAVACVSGALLAGLVVERGRQVRPELACFAVLTVLGTLFEIKQGPVFDRYLLPLTIPALAVVFSAPRASAEAAPARLRSRPASVSRVNAVAASAAGALLAGVTLVLTVNGLVFDAATWKAATAIADANRIDASRVDAGFAWVGYHSASAMRVTPDASAERGIYGMDAFFRNDHPCYVVAAAPQNFPNWTLLSTPGYKKYGVFGAAHLYVYRTGETSCP